MITNRGRESAEHGSLNYDYFIKNRKRLHLTDQAYRSPPLHAGERLEDHLPIETFTGIGL